MFEGLSSLYFPQPLPGTRHISTIYCCCCHGNKACVGTFWKILKTKTPKVGKLKHCYNFDVGGSIKLIFGTTIVWAKTHLCNSLFLFALQQVLFLELFQKGGKLRAPKVGKLKRNIRRQQKTASVFFKLGLCGLLRN